MAFWSDATQTDPKRQYRFTVDLGGKIVQYAVKKADKPSFAVSEAEHKYLNHTYYYPGRVSWNAVTITLVDQGGLGLGEDTASAISEIIEASGYLPHGEDGTKNVTMSKIGATTALKHVKIVQINSSGDPVETWTLVNAWINDVKYGDLAYDGDDLTEVTISLRYDWAELETDVATVWKR